MTKYLPYLSTKVYKKSTSFINRAKLVPWELAEPKEKRFILFWKNRKSTHN